MIEVKIIKDSIGPNKVRLTTFVLTYPRMIHAEVLTHRLFSRNASSCLSGDTKITINKPSAAALGKTTAHMQITIKELVDKWFDGDSKGRSLKHRLKEMPIRCLNEENGIFQTTKLLNCFRSGPQDVYEVELENGYKITCTDNHRIYTESGWSTLKAMGLEKRTSGIVSWNKESPPIATNGFELTVAFLRNEQRLGKTLVQIAKDNNLNYKRLAWFAEKNKIRFQKIINTPNETFEYLDRDWLLEKKQARLTNGRIAELCNTTEDRVKKAARKLKIKGFIGVILKGNKRRMSWNKHKTYKQTKLDKTREAAKKRIKPESYKNYKDFNASMTRFLNEIRVEMMNKYNYSCVVSGVNRNLELHHIAPVWFDKTKAFDKNNIVVLNKKIHRFIHANNLDLEFMKWVEAGKCFREFINTYENLKKTVTEISKPTAKGRRLTCRFYKIKDIIYRGVQQTYDIEVEGPYHNFVANGFVVHNSRAIPVKKQIQMVLDNPAVPLAFTKNKKGMQGGEPLQDEAHELATDAWLKARDAAVTYAQTLSDLEVHKQYANRILEPFAHISVVCTSTDYDNFFKLRIHKDAQPEIQELARQMHQALQNSTPESLNIFQWHLPFILPDDYSQLSDYIRDKQLTGFNILQELLIKVSVARCARVSYLTHDGKNTNIEQDLNLYERLVGSSPEHYSPTEHQAMAHTDPTLLSGNFKGWIQYRQILQKAKQY